MKKVNNLIRSFLKAIKIKEKMSLNHIPKNHIQKKKDKQRFKESKF